MKQEHHTETGDDEEEEEIGEERRGEEGTRLRHCGYMLCLVL